jgi:cytochrome P450
MCIGARLAQIEIYATLSRVIRDHRIALNPPGQQWRVRNDFLTKPEPYPSVTFTPRGA